MPRYFLKPIVWNTNGYQRPSGAHFTSGYPKETGFGHEEWNNASNNIIEENGNRHRLFYTQPLGNFPVDQHRGDIFLFMIASHSGGQYLVGIAGDCVFISSPAEIKALTRHNLWRQAWVLPSVKACFHNNEQAFLRQWEKEHSWHPNWKCPDSMFLWLSNPCFLNPAAITGRNRLIARYGVYQEIDSRVAAQLLSLVPPNQQPWAARLRDHVGRPDLELKTDLEELRTAPGLRETTREALIQARIGQGKFRLELDRLWSERCAVTGCPVRETLRASHIKRWRDSSNRERLDPYNGFLLVATLDALFECGLISFDDTGHMLISQTLQGLSITQKQELGLGKPLQQSPSPKHVKYLSHHRRTWGF